MNRTKTKPNNEPSDRRLRRLTRELDARNTAADQLDAARKHAKIAETSFRQATRHLINGRRIVALFGKNNEREVRAVLKAVVEARAEFRTATKRLLVTAARLRRTLPQEQRLTNIMMRCLADLRVPGQLPIQCVLRKMGEHV